MRGAQGEVGSSRRIGPHRSFWLQEALEHETGDPLLPLRGSASADVAIVGGGFVGLWTAIRIREREPDCDVVILEQDICGGGASGRNGGMALSWWPKLASLTARCGAERAVAVAQASQNAIGEIGLFCEHHEIDADFRPGGMLWTATTQSQIGAWEDVLRFCGRAGVEPFERLTPGEVAERSGSSVHLAGILEPTAATVQPALLARGLRRVALELGVRIYEGTTVRSFTRRRPVEVSVDGGTLTADRLVLASGAWATREKELSRSMVIVSSDIVATEPIPERLLEIGWGDESITDSQMMVNYYRTTRDGRIAFGKGTAGLTFRNRIGETFDSNAEHDALVERELRRTYPMLDDVRVTHGWGGPIDRTPSSLPILGHLGSRENIVYGVGWSGNGVAPSVVGGRILCSLALGIRDEWSEIGLVDLPHERFPPEPARYLGGRLVRAAVVRKEDAQRRGMRPRAMDVRLSELAPAGLEDK